MDFLTRGSFLTVFILVCELPVGIFGQGLCQDSRMVNCPSLLALCRSNQQVQQLCPQTCNSASCFSSCRDFHPRCPYLTAYCAGNDAVKKTCPFSCGNCDQGGSVAKWGKWKKWEDCDCATGKQTRYRECDGNGCPGENSEERDCQPSDCAGGDCRDLEDWCGDYKGLCSWHSTVIANCEKTCGLCKGDSQKPNWSDWEPWKPCTVTCGEGTEERSRKCRNGPGCKGKATEVRVCVKHPCPEKWTEWGEYSACSAPCGGGSQKRTRECTEGACKGEIEEDIIACNVEKCEGTDGYYDWTPWNRCSAACGGGVHERYRDCKMQGQCTKHDRESENCNEQRCQTGGNCRDDHPSCGSWARRGFCSASNVLKMCSLSCQNCPSGGSRGEWSEYGRCSVLCGVGEKTRTRGRETQSITCKEAPCEGGVEGYWGEWSPYGTCSEPCGPGVQLFKRVCSVQGTCPDKDEKTEPCNLKECKGVWSSWSNYGECSESCGPGEQRSERTCSIPGTCPGNDIRTRKCNLKKCPGWKNWGSWSACSEKCNGGVRTRKRVCSEPSKCTGNAEDTESCNQHKCPEWTEWGEWGECSAKCGTGEKVRKRSCSVRGGCDGLAREREPCNEFPCGGSWTKCTLGCGTGSQYKLNCTDGGCTRKYKHCHKNKCAAAPCGGNTEARYGLPHACCEKFSLAPGEPICGTTENVGRIIGGTAAKVKQWPWQVAIHMHSGFCAAIVISKTFVLSAAHCFQYESGTPMKWDDWILHFGLLNTDHLGTQQGTMSIGIKDVFVHPEYDFPTADIALVELKSALKFTSFIRPVCLPGGEVTPQDTTCYVTGWGSDASGVSTAALQELGIKILDVEVCKATYKIHMKAQYDFVNTDDRIICAGSLDQYIDSCHGDSGGPLVCQRCTGCTWYLAGIVSFGPSPCAMEGVPAIYTKVLPYEEWIRQKTGIAELSHTCSRKYGP